MYAIIGWLYEVFLEVVVYRWGYSDRGVLFGPYCPVYGVGALLFIFLIIFINFIFFIISFVFVFALLVSLLIKPVLFERYFCIFIPLFIINTSVFLSFDYKYKLQPIIILIVFLSSISFPKYENFNLFDNINLMMKYSYLDSKNNNEYQSYFIVPDKIEYVKYFPYINKKQVIILESKDLNNPNSLDNILEKEFHQYYDENMDHPFTIGHENGHSFGPDSSYKTALGIYQHIIEEYKADVTSIAMMKEYVKSGVISETDLKKIYVTWVMHLLLKAKPQEIKKVIILIFAQKMRKMGIYLHRQFCYNEI